MTVPRRLALLSALALTGCVATQDEPFPLDDGDAVAPAANGYVCDSWDAKAKKAAAAQQGRLIPLRRNKKTQYVFLDDKASSAEPFTLHRAKGNSHVVAVAHSDGPGEDLYLAEFANAGNEFKLYAEVDGLRRPRARRGAPRRRDLRAHPVLQRHRRPPRSAKGLHARHGVRPDELDDIGRLPGEALRGRAGAPSPPGCRVGAEDCSSAPLTEPDVRASHPALWIVVSERKSELL